MAASVCLKASAKVYKISITSKCFQEKIAKKLRFCAFFDKYTLLYPLFRLFNSIEHRLHPTTYFNGEESNNITLYIYDSHVRLMNTNYVGLMNINQRADLMEVNLIMPSTSQQVVREAN